MSPIELTDLHKSKLLEMCEMLFPEYTIYEIQKANHFGRIINIVQGNKWESDDDDQYPVDEFFIHWFEFCMTKLVDKLYSNIDYTDSSEFNINLHVDLMLDMVNFKINPIDILYKEFLKTKTNDK